MWQFGPVSQTSSQVGQTFSQYSLLPEVTMFTSRVIRIVKRIPIVWIFEQSSPPVDGLELVKDRQWWQTGRTPCHCSGILFDDLEFALSVFSKGVLVRFP